MAFETAFERYQSEVEVTFRTVPQSSESSVTFFVGESAVGPYPLVRAASGIGAAVQAERLEKSHQAAAMQRAERENAEENFLSKWRVFD